MAVGRTTVKVELRGTSVAVPVAWVGAGAGPTVAVTANVHGDECTGVAAAHRLLDVLDAGLLRGTVHVYPSLNPQGLEAGTRGAGPDGVDLNRQFPGGSGGDLATRLAGALWRDLTARRPELLIDLHADSANAIPYAIVDRPVRLTGAARARLEERLLQHAEATGLTVLQEYPDEVYLRFGLDRSLPGALVNYLHLPAVTIEAGPRRVVDPAAVGLTVDAVLRVLARLGMVEAPTSPTHRTEGGPWRRASGPRTRVDGVVHPVVAAGVPFAKGDVIAVVRALDGTAEEAVVSAQAGIVVSWVDGCWFPAGTVIATLGIAEDR